MALLERAGVTNGHEKQIKLMEHSKGGVGSLGENICTLLICYQKNMNPSHLVVVDGVPWIGDL